MEGGYVPILGSWVRNTNSIPDTEAFPSLIDLTMTTDREEDASLGGALSCLKTLFGILLCGGSEVALTVALLTLASNAEPRASQHTIPYVQSTGSTKYYTGPATIFHPFSCLVHVTLGCFRGLYTRMLLFSACIYILFKL